MKRTFTDDEVLAILQSEESTNKLASDYDVSYQVIYNIRTGKSYTHVAIDRQRSHLRNTDTESILELVRANYSLSAIAAHTGLSARAIGRLWLRETGMTVREYRRGHQVRYGDRIL